MQSTDHVLTFAADDDSGFSLRFSAEPRRLALFGELGTRSAALLVELADQLPAGGDLAVNLAAVSYLNPAGLDALVTLYDGQRAAGVQLTVDGVSPRLARVFESGNCSWLLGRRASASVGHRTRSGRRFSRADRTAIDDALREIDVTLRRLARESAGLAPPAAST